MDGESVLELLPRPETMPIPQRLQWGETDLPWIPKFLASSSDGKSLIIVGTGGINMMGDEKKDEFFLLRFE